MLQKASNWLLAICIFLIPSNLFLVLQTSQAYVNGLLSDYLITKVFVLDIVLIFLLVLNWQFLYNTTLIWWQKYPRLATMLLVFGVLQIVTSSNQIATGWYILQLLKALVLGVFLNTYGWTKPVVLSLISAVFFQILLAWYQFLSQSSLAGFWLLGEPNLAAPFGIQQTEWLGRILVLPYGTTPHPNILAGFLVACLVVLHSLKKKISKQILVAISIAIIVSVIATQSFSAVIASLFLGLRQVLLLTKVGIHLKPNLAKTYLAVATTIVVLPILISVAFPNLLTHSSYSRRAILNQAGLNIWVQAPVLGSGLNAVTTQIEQVVERNQLREFVQPPHNALVWLLASGGAASIFLVGWWAILNYQLLLRLAPKLFILSPILAWDHYLASLPIGLLILCIVVSSPEIE